MSGKTNLKISVLVAALSLAMVSTTFAGRVIYVDADATGKNVGSSWADAFNYLQDALNAAWSGDEIWVAQGIYKPDRGACVTPGNRMANFGLEGGLIVNGGYAGFGEPNPNARDIDLYETILSGDVMGNDREVSDPCGLLNDPCRADNSYNVVTSYDNDATAVLDGFTITAGNANYKFDWRRDSRSQGGGMYNESGSPTIIKCNFRLNSARRGGGMFNSNQDDICNPSLNECTFYKNFAQNEGGGGMYNYGNYGYYRRGPYPKLVNCIFSENSTEHNGGGMCNWDCSPTLTDCIFINNSALKAGGGLCNDGACDTKIINCKFIANLAGSGGGMYNWGDPEYECYPSLNNCIFSHNSGCSRGGGLYNYGYCDPTITNCSFITNTAIFGGGMADDWTASPVLINCLYSANTAQYGGGLYNNGSPYHRTGPKFTNCTFTQNSANSGNALACDSQDNEYRSTILMTNCILWDGGNEIWNNDNSVITISYSDVQGSRPGEGNIDTDPCFADPGYWDANGVWVDGDYHLLPDSPCINTGDPNYIAEPNETDLDGKPRIIAGRIDMGAYEYSTTIPAEARIVPRTINLASQGKWIGCYIWLPEDYNVADIDPNSLLLEYEIGPEQLWVNEEKQVVMVRFSREEIQAILEAGQVELTITGQLSDGTIFEAKDVIIVINKGSRKSAK
ncbi:MAG TPA: choice-of-anchor Q domain-containing protein [Sedimentisphaerales bacterium]|nr:choice-of-anchor Q domain-containing protein [Sedimentisphaerales bacterium]